MWEEHGFPVDFPLNQAIDVNISSEIKSMVNINSTAANKNIERIGCLSFASCGFPKRVDHVFSSSHHMLKIPVDVYTSHRFVWKQGPPKSTT